MREIIPNLFCGSEIDFTDSIDNEPDVWAILHACKEPFHRCFVGYTGRGCPKESSEYLWADRGNRLALNIVDAPKAEFFDKSMIDKALDFIEQKLNMGYKVLVHCNQGESRSPSIVLLYLIKQDIIKGDTFSDCEAEFVKTYPEYNPGIGIREFLKAHFK